MHGIRFATLVIAASSDIAAPAGFGLQIRRFDLTAA
jgi:hypothetical protein